MYCTRLLLKRLHRLASVCIASSFPWLPRSEYASDLQPSDQINVSSQDPGRSGGAYFCTAASYDVESYPSLEEVRPREGSVRGGSLGPKHSSISPNSDERDPDDVSPALPVLFLLKVDFVLSSFSQ